MAETGEVDGSSITGIIGVNFAGARFSISNGLTVSQINKSTVRERRVSSLSKWRKMNHHFQWWTIPVLQPRLVDLGAVEGLSSAAVEEAVVTNVAEGAHSNG